MDLNINSEELVAQAGEYTKRINLLSAHRNKAKYHMDFVSSAITRVIDQHQNTVTKLLELEAEVKRAEHQLGLDMIGMRQRIALNNGHLNSANRELANITEGGHKGRNARKKVQERIDTKTSAINSWENSLQQAQAEARDLGTVSSHIRLWIEIVYRKLVNAKLSQEKLESFDNTGLAYLAHGIRGGVLSQRVNEFSFAVASQDGVSSRNVERTLMNNLPGENFYETAYGKDIVTYFNSGDASLITGAAQQRITERGLLREKYPSGFIPGEKEAFDKSRAEYDKRIEEQADDYKVGTSFAGQHVYFYGNSQSDGMLKINQEASRNAQDYVDGLRRIEGVARAVRDTAAIAFVTLATAGAGTAPAAAGVGARAAVGAGSRAAVGAGSRAGASSAARASVGAGARGARAASGGARGARAASGGSRGAGSAGARSAGPKPGSSGPGAGTSGGGSSTAGAGGGNAGSRLATGSKEYLKVQSQYIEKTNRLNNLGLEIRNAQRAGNRTLVDSLKLERSNLRSEIKGFQEILLGL